MELNHLKHFFEVAKSGSFAKAAQRLRISQSSLSKAVALLEESGKVTLFTRSKFGVVLTPIGQEVFGKCEKLFETFTDIEATCLQKSETPEGPLRIGASDHVAKYLLVKILKKLKGQHPRLRPSLFSSGPNEIVASILNGETELGLFFTQVSLSQIHYETISHFPMAVVCHPSLAPVKLTGTIGELKRHVKEIGLIASIDSRYGYNPSERAIEQLGHPPVNFEINSQESQKQMCLEKGGATVLARFMVEHELKAGKLVELSLRNPIRLPLYLAERNGRARSHNAQVFLTMFRDLEEVEG